MLSWHSGLAGLRVERTEPKEMILHAHATRGSPHRGGGGRCPLLRSRSRRLAAALLCALLAAVTVAVEPPGQPAGAAASDQSGGSQDPPATPTTSAPAPTTSAPAAASVGSLSRLTAALVDGSVLLGWDSPYDDAVSKYQYQIRTMGAGGDYGAWTDIPGSGASTVVHSISVTGSERRNVRVRAVNAAGTSLYYGVASTDVPEAPSRLRASLSGGSVSLSWDDPDDDFIDSYWYRIKKAGASNAYSNLIKIEGSGASTTSATISVTGEGRRIVELQARSAVLPGWGARYKPAVASTGPPAAPSGYMTPGGTADPVAGGWPWVKAPASAPKGEIDLHWSDPGDASIIKYQYQLRPARQTSVWSQWIDLPGSDASTTSYKFVFPTHEQYRFRLRAINSVGAAGNSRNLIPSWPAPAVPSGLKATLSGNSVSLSWDNPYDSSIWRYQYRIKTAGAANAYGSWTDITGSNSATTSTTITVTGSERRVVQLRATNVGGSSSPASASTGLPAQPSGFTTPATKGTYRSTDDGYVVVTAATSLPKGQVVVSWSDPGDDSIIKYQYSFRPTGTPDANSSKWIDIPGSSASTTSHTFVMLTPEEYRVRVRAVNEVGAISQIVHVKPSWPVPPAPSGFKATLSGNSVSLSWNTPYHGYSLKYQYRIKTVGTESTYSDWTDIADSAITGLNFAPTLSTTIAVTGSGQRIVQLRSNLRGPGNHATASTE